MDLVYIVGPDPHHEFIELRYSIRSMYKYLDKFDRIIIMGECPPFLKNVIHIPQKDLFKFNRDRNIYEKILAACRYPDLSDHFWCASDDHFLLSKVSNRNYPYFYCADLEATIGRLGKYNYYKPHLIPTIEVLRERKLPTLNFNVHLPIIFRKDIFIEVMTSYNWDIPKGYTVKSLYANSLKIPGRLVKDNKFQTPKTKTAIARKVAKSFFFSTTEHAINAEMIQTFHELYPDPSPVECL